jgi:hypothetical protein
MKKIIEHLTKFSREFLIISLSLLLLINTIVQSSEKKVYQLQSVENKELRNMVLQVCNKIQEKLL